MTDRLNEMLRGVVRTGTFTLSSGKTSDFYFNGKELSLIPEGSVLIAERFADWLAEDRPAAFGGPELGACPMVSATGVIAHQRGLDLSLFYVRKQPKEYGTASQLEGPPLEPGQRAILCEDVITTGGSLLRAVTVVRDLGVTVDTVYTIVDREEGGTEAMAEAGLTLRSLFRKSELRDD